ncbi:STE like transcription factor-domain-containing protein [Scheffersomyces coipomensis]|uniref:STE like transcription factor-domain-containing protein n=1 Tax=Scheffersomyces coipomensis TaxID=1788519 RepID=UPI00315D0079
MSGLPIKSENSENSVEHSEDVQESLRLIEDLKFFLATAPANWQENQVIRRYYLNHDEGFVSCVFWNNLYFITGTDIVRCIVYKFEHFGRKIIDRKKFEEGIFSDLRNLKCGADAILEPPRSDFLEFLFKNNCLRTQKKQKVFFWFNVPHDKLMADALERDLKKEKQDQKSTTIAKSEPALSFQYDETQSLFTQLADHMKNQKTISDDLEQNTITDKSSPEYSSNSNLLQTNTNGQGNDYEFLNHATPVQYKGNSDTEDDFPLDYFDPNGQMISDDFVNLETVYRANNNDSINYHNNNSVNHHNNPDFIDENYDSVDASFFAQPLNQAGSGTSQVAYNEEYLIEQTLPLRGPPVSQLPLSNIPPKSSKIMSASEEFFPPFQPMQHQPSLQQLQPQVLPLSAKFQNFPRNALTPSQVMFPPQYYDQGGQVLYQQQPLQLSQLPPQQVDYQVPYNMVQHEPEYWLPYYGEPSAPYMVANDSEYMQPTVVPVAAAPAPVVSYSGGMRSISRAPYVPKQPGTSKPKKKKNKNKNNNGGGVSKPQQTPVAVSAPINPTPKASLDEVISIKNTRIITKVEDESEDFDGGIPTPTASNTQVDGNATDLI